MYLVCRFDVGGPNPNARTLGNMEEIVIASTRNERVKGWKRLAKRSERDATQSFLVEGRRETERLSHILRPLEWIRCATYSESLERLPDATAVSTDVFDAISRRQNPDGVAAVFATPRFDLDTFDPGPEPMVLVADGLEKPGNLGAMMRTCDAFGAAILASDPKTDLVNPNVVRAAQGSLLATPTAQATSEEAVQWCTANTTTFVLRPDDSIDLWEVDLRGPISIVIGAESNGVGSAWDEVGTGVRIPTRGTADSLNASVAAAVAVAEAVRQRSPWR